MGKTFHNPFNYGSDPFAMLAPDGYYYILCSGWLFYRTKDLVNLEPLGKALRVSVPELLCGQTIVNRNRSANMLKSRFYVCPVCGNVLFARGDAMISCCGIQLPALEEEEPDEAHRMEIQRPEDELYVFSDHRMSKDHYLSFIAYMTPDRCEIKTLYPEGNAEARFFFRGAGRLYCYCNQHGLFMQKI